MSSYVFEGKTVWYAGAPGSPFPSVTNAPVKYDDIKRQYNKDNLFVDPDFPCTFKDMIGNIGGDSAGGLGTVDPNSYTWARPQKLCDAQSLGKPNFAIMDDDGSCGNNVCSALDIRQGTLGDCWYVCAVQNLTTRQDLLKVVIPEDNFVGFDDANYCGAFHFRFYSIYQDAWLDIVVDDLLPAQNLGNVLLAPAFADITSRDNETASEFWSPLIEKAYAKFIGTYADINGGFPSQALEDFTGGFSEITKFSSGGEKFGLAALQDKTPYEMFQSKIAGYLRGGYFVALCTVDPTDLKSNDILRAYSKPQVQIGLNQRTDGTFAIERTEMPKGYVYSPYRGVQLVDKPGLGLNGPHAYSILDAQELKRNDGSGSVFLVKMKNPHGGDEWQGNYSDKDDASWGQLEKDLRARNAQGSADIDEGVFWMELSDIIRYFDSVEACLFGFTDGTTLAIARGEWPASIQYTPTTASDPTSVNNFTAYKFEVQQGAIAKGYGAAIDGKAVLAVTVVLGGYKGLWFPYPRFIVYLYKVRDDGDVDATRREIASYQRSHVASWGYNIAREVSRWTFVDPGSYLLIAVPDTASRGGIPAALIQKPIPYAVRVFTENETTITAHEPTAAPAQTAAPPLAQFGDQIEGLGFDDATLNQLRQLGLY